jgi:UDP-N-acetylglucosamine/UDP-N-acetylgalactosamine 4-epimerase
MTSFHSENLSDKTFLVTGGAGFIGSHIAEYLCFHGAKKVRVLDNLLTGSQSNIDLLNAFPNFEFLNGDIRDLNTCKTACEGIEYVLHQAALGSVPRSIQEPENTNAINVSGTLHMLIAAKDAKVKRFVYASSSSVYGDNADLPKVEHKIGRHLSPYAVSKYSNELYAGVFNMNYRLEVIGLRYFNVFGPRQNPNGPYAAVIPLFINNLQQNEPVYINGDGEQSRDFTFIENVVQVNIKSLFANKEAVNKVYNVAVGENFSVNRMFNHIAELLGSSQKAIHREERKGDIRDSLADISLAKKHLHYNPGIKFKEGLIETIKYFQSL